MPLAADRDNKPRDNRSPLVLAPTRETRPRRGGKSRRKRPGAPHAAEPAKAGISGGQLRDGRLGERTVGARADLASDRPLVYIGVSFKGRIYDCGVPSIGSAACLEFKTTQPNCYALSPLSLLPSFVVPLPRARACES